jgi:hypothetical protein
LALAALTLAPLWGCGSNRSGGDGTTTAQTPEEILRATAFVGADRCGVCHAELHAGWQLTAHTQKLRDGSVEANYTNDGDLDGRSDFFKGTDINIRNLPGGSKFDVYGANAPILGSDSTGPYVKLANPANPAVKKKFYINFTLGGSAVQSKTAGDVNGDGLILNAEAQWKQRYITMIGKSNYLLPLQFNQQTGQYTTYDTDKWFIETKDASGTVISATPKTDAVPPGKNNSYERRCAGCHVTGLQVALEGDQWVMEFSDISVACEACHGPGGRHAASPTKTNIINPATLTTTEDLNDDGTVNQVDNLLVRNYVCYPCHSRGLGKYSATTPTGATTLEYSTRPGPNGEALIYLPSLDWKDYFDVTETRDEYWGGGPQSGNFIISKGHHQEQQDHAAGPHGADRTFDHACFECHDLHNPARLHLVATEIVVDGVTVTNNGTATNPADNRKLCLACHVTHGDFADLTLAQVNLDTNAAGSPVRTTIQSHQTNRAYMDVGFATQCSNCHMPKTAKTAIEYTFATNVQVGDQTISLTTGDIAGHTADIIWPNYVMQSATFSWTSFKKFWEDTFFVDPGDGTAPIATVGPIPNSCMNTGCHQPGIDDDIVTQWFGSGHADGYGVPFNDWNADGVVSASCVKCHTQGGYIQFVNGETLTEQSAIYPKVLGCESCHEPNGGGDTFFEAGKVQQVVFPANRFAVNEGQDPTTFAVRSLGDSSNICAECHQGRASGLTVKYATPNTTVQIPDYDSFSFVNRHYFAAAAIRFGTEVQAGFEYPGRTYLGENTFPAHPSDPLDPSNNLTKCAGCHLREGTTHHSFEPDIARCGECHLDAEALGLLTDFNKLGLPFGTANFDYDGDGTGESFQGEIDGLEALLLTAIMDYAANTLNSPIVYGPGSYPYWFKDLDGDGIGDPEELVRENGYPDFDMRLLQSAYNYHSNQDPCGDIHNYRYVIQTAYDSIDDLDDLTLNNSVQGTAVAATRP